jgi:ABC-type multidrug transport system fused ATPase/permease subunit
MDEATANIDITTEEIIQNAIHTFFKDTTIITIAHRIKTIIDYDRILVLQDGQVEEFDTPANLIKNQDSIFYELYSKSSL